MATLSVKPGQRFTLPDWHTNSDFISADAERQRSTSHQVRQEGRALRNETNNQVGLLETEQYGRAPKSGCLDEGIGGGFTSTDPAKYVYLIPVNPRASKNLSLDVAIECLTLRESRRAIDVVRDHVEEQLHKEVKLIEKAKRELQERVDEAFEQLCLLQEARQQLSFDHRCKMEALEIDRVCLSLSVDSPNISYKVNPTRVPDGTTGLDGWEQNSQGNKENAEAEMKASTKVREQTMLTIAQTNNALEAQRLATEFAFRKRIRDLERAYDELKWQEQNVSVASCVIDHNLGWELKPKGWFLCGRLLGMSVVSPCHVAHVQYGLTDEVHQLEATIRALKEKLAEAQDALSALYRQLHRIQTDMGYKANSLVLDNKCMDSRRKLVVPAEKFVPEVDTFNRTTNRPLSPLKNGQLELA
ncbi:TEKT2 protein, partial [Columbina picui]|nr:TEKT2 protein [Columbina picui]